MVHFGRGAYGICAAFWASTSSAPRKPNYQIGTLPLPEHGINHGTRVHASIYDGYLTILYSIYSSNSTLLVRTWTAGQGDG